MCICRLYAKIKPWQENLIIKDSYLQIEKVELNLKWMIAVSVKGHLKGKNYILFVNDNKMDVHSMCFLDFYAYCIN